PHLCDHHRTQPGYRAGAHHHACAPDWIGQPPHTRDGEHQRDTQAEYGDDHKGAGDHHRGALDILQRVDEGKHHRALQGGRPAVAARLIHRHGVDHGGRDWRYVRLAGPEVLHGSEKGRRRYFATVATDLTPDHFGDLLPVLVDIAHLEVDQLHTVTAVSKTLQGAFQLAAVHLGLFGEAICTVLEVIGERRVLGEGAKIVFSLGQIARARLGRLTARGDEPHCRQD